MIAVGMTALCLALHPIPLAAGWGGQPQVESAALGDLGVELAPRVAERTAPILTEAGYDASTVRISMGWLNAAEFHYAIKVALDPDTPLGQARLTATCRDCSSDQLVEAAAKGVTKAIEDEKQRLRDESQPEPLSDDPTSLVPEESEGSVIDSPTESDGAAKPGRVPLRPLGWAGVGTLGAGLAVAVTGGVFIGLGERRPADDMSQLRDFRPSGYGLLATGGALLVAGAIMLGVERAKSKQSARRAWVLPVGTSRHAGVAVHVRF